jgi:hypothetical protein
MQRLLAVPWKVVVVAAVFGGLLAGVGAAAMPSSSDDDVISACVNPHSGKLRVVGTTASCKGNEQGLEWNKRGPQGERGPAGPQGPKGDTGATGAQGPKGDTGATGAQGPKGDTGATGAQGPKGDAGATGATGAQGPKGDTGATGATGAQGPKGDTGATGAQGPQGPVGPQGPAGPAFVATGFINSDGTVIASHGPAPTVSRTSQGHYSFSISGVGGGCVLPALTPVATSTTIFLNGGSCGAGGVTTSIETGDGQDHLWSYLLAGVADGTAPLADAAARLPRN